MSLATKPQMQPVLLPPKVQPIPANVPHLQQSRVSHLRPMEQLLKHGAAMEAKYAQTLRPKRTLMKYHTVIGYTYDADLHCCNCAREHFGHEPSEDDEDSQGNEP